MPRPVLEASFPLLSESDLEELLSITESVKIGEGTVLLEEGHAADAMYLITDGVVSITKNLGEVEIVVASLAEGELIGEMSFAGNFSATATVRASCDLEALKIDNAKLMAKLDGNPRLGMAVYHSITLTMARRLLQMNEQFVFLSN